MLRLPQGPSLAIGLFCPGRSSLNRPHPSHSWAHRDFTARRLIRDAFAVRERLGDPRVVPSFHCTFLPGMPSSPTTGSPTSIFPELRCRHWPSPNDHRLGTPNTPAIRSTRAVDFVASLVRFRYSLPGCLPPCTDLTGILPQPPGTFTSRLSTDRSSSPLLDITTTATGLLVWGFFCQEVSAERPIFFPSSVSLFDLKARFFVPTALRSRRRAQELSRLAVAPTLQHSALSRPYLDGFEHDGTFGA